MLIDLLEELEPWCFQHVSTRRATAPLTAREVEEIHSELEGLDLAYEEQEKEGVIVVVTPDFNQYILATDMTDAIEEIGQDWSAYQEWVVLIGVMPSEILEQEDIA